MEGKDQDDTGDTEMTEKIALSIEASVSLATNVALLTTKQEQCNNSGPYLAHPHTSAELKCYKQQQVQQCLF